LANLAFSPSLPGGMPPLMDGDWGGGNSLLKVQNTQIFLRKT